MTVIELRKIYEYPDIDKLARLFNDIEREKYLMGIAQAYFDEHENDRVNWKDDRICLGFEQDDTGCNLMRDGDFLVLYGIERGKRRVRALFTSIYNALDFIALTYFGIPGLPFDWPELNRQFDEQ